MLVEILFRPLFDDCSFILSNLTSRLLILAVLRQYGMMLAKTSPLKSSLARHVSSSSLRAFSRRLLMSLASSPAFFYSIIKLPSSSSSLPVKASTSSCASSKAQNFPLIFLNWSLCSFVFTHNGLLMTGVVDMTCTP